MARIKLISSISLMAVGLAACAETPQGPHVQVLPAANKPFEVFAQEQAYCKQYAHDQVAGQAKDANDKAVIETLLSAALGAGLGGAVGGGHGAGVGAATGGVVGAAVGTSTSDRSRVSIQQQYDNAYSQCMYAKGNQVVQQPATVHVVHPVYYAPPPPVYYAAPPTVYAAPPVVYAQPPAAAAAPPPPQQGYTPPAGAVAPPPGTAAPQ